MQLPRNVQNANKKINLFVLTSTIMQFEQEAPFMKTLGCNPANIQLNKAKMKIKRNTFIPNNVNVNVNVSQTFSTYLPELLTRHRLLPCPFSPCTCTPAG